MVPHSSKIFFSPICLRAAIDVKARGQTHLNLTRSLIGDQYQSGALWSYSGNSQVINLRVGISFVSAAQACQNAEEEVGDASFEDIVSRSKALWNERLSKIEIDVPNTPRNVTEMLYSSLYRASLTPVSVLELLIESPHLHKWIW